jgi:glycosyltransferase involved in cell wall biosynthesis
MQLQSTPEVLPPIAPSTARRSTSIVHLLAPAPVGGLERVVSALALGQLRRGHRVCVVMFAYGPGELPLAREMSAAGIAHRVVRVPARGYLAERRASRVVLAELRPDIVHTHGFRVDLVSGPVARALGIPSVATVHGRTGGGLKMRLYEWAQYTSLRRRDAVVAVSRPLVGILGRHGVRSDRIHLIANAWADGASGLTRAAARQSLGIGELDPAAAIVGFVGRLSREKGADVLIRAIAALRDRAIHAVILGDGSEAAVLEQLATRLGVRDRVHFRGTVPDAGRLLAALDVFVLSSRTEGTPIALFEAIAAGIPVVATRVGGVPDVVSEREALLVPSEHPAALAAAISDALANKPAARARATAAAARLRTSFTAEPWLDRHDALYWSLIDAAPRTPSQLAIPR